MTAEKNSLVCHICAKDFKYDSERRRHEQSHFPQFRCKVCSKNFSFISALRRHMKQHERTGNVKCDKCSRTFRDQMLLKRHIKYAHGDAYTCTKCDTVLSSQPALRSHMKTHRLETEKKYQCSFVGCTKAFNFPHHLRHHELTHTNSKQHFCGTCGKGFIQYHHLKAHVKTHDPHLSLYCPYPECSKKFATEYARKRHLAKHQNIMDSGISSDSNSTCDASITSDLTNGSIHTTGDATTKDCVDHKLDYNLNQSELNDTPQDLSVGKTKEYFSQLSITKDEISDCKNAIVERINDEKEKYCVSAEISNNNPENYDCKPVESKVNKLSLDDIKFEDLCEGCACSDHCNVQKVILSIIDVMPELHYTTDGAVKIKDTFDVDFIKETDNKSDKIIPYNSCKDVLGNCIVSGNGIMGDGCLCAKMSLEGQVTAQEIEDITPHPGNEAEGFT